MGGSECLAVDAALGLQVVLGHSVDLGMPRRDPQHYFDEARDGM